MAQRNIRQKLLAASRIAKNEGVPTLAVKGLKKVHATIIPGAKTKHHLHTLVSYEDAQRADWSKKRQWKKPVKKDSYTVNWVMSPPGKGSGGHQNLFRFIRFLEQAGHTCRIYLYSTFDKRSIAEVNEVLKDSYAKINASIEWLDGEMAEADAIFATGWETAYPVFLSKSDAQRFYFVQDYEPYFYPTGSESILAENTYRFNFFGVTAGGWLANKLRSDFKMETDHFDFGADTAFYENINKEQRKEIFFYARPVTPRRGFEIGIMALDLFHQKHPEYTINLAGWDVSDYDIPFPFKNLSSLPLSDLPGLYNCCSVALVMSLTNMSLLPLELMACGVIPVVNDGDNNRQVSDNKYIEYVANNPQALADRLSEVVSRKDLLAHSQKASDSPANQNWDASGAKFVQIVERKLRNG